MRAKKQPNIHLNVSSQLQFDFLLTPELLSFLALNSGLPFVVFIIISPTGDQPQHAISLLTPEANQRRTLPARNRSSLSQEIPTNWPQMWPQITLPTAVHSASSFLACHNSPKQTSNHSFFFTISWLPLFKSIQTYFTTIRKKSL